MLVVLGVAVVLATLASWGVYRTIQQMPVREVTVVERQMVVASQAVDVGIVLTDAHVKLIPWPAAAPVPGGFETLTDVVGRGVTVPLVPNEVVIENKLAPRDGGAGLSPTIPAGMRGMAVRVNDVIGVAGFATPGTRVDVVVTIRTDNDSVSRVVVNNVRVIASGTRADVGAAREGRPAQSTVVTLLVTPQDAERLALAQSQGSIVLALRNPLDTAPVETRGVRTAGLLSEGAPAAPAPVRSGPARPRATPAAPPPPPPAPYTVETIKGAERTQVIIKTDKKPGIGPDIDSDIQS
jgi:pilus assembly protein CpaB